MNKALNKVFVAASGLVTFLAASFAFGQELRPAYVSDFCYEVDAAIEVLELFSKEGPSAGLPVLRDYIEEGVCVGGNTVPAMIYNTPIYVTQNIHGAWVGVAEGYLGDGTVIFTPVVNLERNNDEGS